MTVSAEGVGTVLGHRWGAPALTGPGLDEALAARLARLALGHVTREYPNSPGHVLSGPDDARGTPRELHPVFFGSYDWHSCVHAHWTLARLLRRFPAMAPAAEARALLDAQLTPEKVAGEVAYFERPTARGFQRPYGWAWLLLLAAELDRHGQAAGPWSAALRPLADLVAARFRAFLPKATYPVRTGTHGNTAFALMLADAHASARDPALAGLLRATAEAWYGRDAGCPAWGEPGGGDFLSPALVEAACMACLLPAERFLPWFDRFLPRLADGEPACLMAPAAVSDRADGQIVHLDGLNLSRAWCFRLLAGALPPADLRRAPMGAAAAAHLAASLPHVAGDYMGEHWLASFAVLALEPVTPAGGRGDGAAGRPR